MSPLVSRISTRDIQKRNITVKTEAAEKNKKIEHIENHCLRKVKFPTI
jgi:hypothetical protein